MKKHIVCFGDSNTHGYCADARDCADPEQERFNENERWTCLLQEKLGNTYLVLEEGLSGRTTVFTDPLHEGLCGIDYIRPCLLSHKPISLLVIMLGTNDTKERFSASAPCIALGMERLVRTAMMTDCWDNGQPNVLIVSPPIIGEEMQTSSVAGTMGKGCSEKSCELAACYATVAARLGCHFMDAKGCAFNEVDYMHLTCAGHAELASRLTEKIAGIAL